MKNMESEHQHLVHVVLYNIIKLEKIGFGYRTLRERRQYLDCRFLLDKLNINESHPLQSYTTIELLRIKIALISYDSTLADDQKKPSKNYGNTTQKKQNGLLTSSERNTPKTKTYE